MQLLKNVFKKLHPDYTGKYGYNSEFMDFVKQRCNPLPTQMRLVVGNGVPDCMFYNNEIGDNYTKGSSIEINKGQPIVCKQWNGVPMKDFISVRGVNNKECSNTNVTFPDNYTCSGNYKYDLTHYIFDTNNNIYPLGYILSIIYQNQITNFALDIVNYYYTHI